MRIVLHLLLLGLLAAAPLAVRAEPRDFTEKLDIGISTDEISITSDFRGADLTIFGAIDGFDANLLAQGKYNIVVALEGPKENSTVRKKERVFGIWINTNSMTFEMVPESYSLSSTRDIDTIAPPADMNNMGIGVNHMPLTPIGFIGDGSNLTEFRDAFRRLRETTGVYQRDPGGVQFISSSLFKASVRLPADVPNGVHIVRAYLFREGVFVAAKALPLRVVKTGLEQAITSAAHEQPFLYGITAVLLAVITGWLASIVFRRD
ncbi:TIGR02186 family protein [Pararhizobium sp. BT-229]|uniref:TIGR02186 family protein n=1 Tax=Pararhizobium sp. BT-229 TaxID=2986923 RepID=UPI0021F799B9|nr:TIGR02186 family protein [Pararhizobium sp. BT-229]MCV9962609.1 TIGR02186 family protein [Pararhizobium sp. BT-229]